MNDNRTGGMLLVTGNVAGLITMGFHPVLRHGPLPSLHEMQRLATLDRAVHGLALGGVLLVFLGAVALSRRLAAGNRLALAALVIYGFAAVAVMVAGTLDGFVAASLLGRLAEGDPKLESWWMLLEYNARMVQAFAAVYTAGTCAAIFLWSLAMVKTHRLAAGLGWYGLALGPVIMLALFSGHLPLGAHGFGLIALAQAVWFVGAGVWLLRSSNEGVDAPFNPSQSDLSRGY